MGKAADWDGRESLPGGGYKDYYSPYSDNEESDLGTNENNELPPVHVGGGSDSRASFAYPGDPDYPGSESSSGRGGTGCLVSLVGGLSILGTTGFGIYETVSYLF